MLSCSIWFSAPSFWMGGGLESRSEGRVCGADGALHGTSNAPDDGRIYPKHVELRIHQNITLLHQVGFSNYFLNPVVALIRTLNRVVQVWDGVRDRSKNI